MATVYITEYAKLAEGDGGKTPNLGYFPHNTQVLTVTASPDVDTASLSTRTAFVEIDTDADIVAKHGEDPAATALSGTSNPNATIVKAGLTKGFGVQKGWKISFRTL